MVIKGRGRSGAAFFAALIPQDQLTTAAARDNVPATGEPWQPPLFFPGVSDSWLFSANLLFTCPAEQHSAISGQRLADQGLFAKKLFIDAAQQGERKTPSPDNSDTSRNDEAGAQQS
ncbi:MAG: hypothetical protein ACOY4W_00655 [Thermodesulfobacteriota bacterium]